MGLVDLMILGLVVFIGAARVVTTPRARARDLIARIGEGPYKGALFAHLDHRRRPDRLWLRALSARPAGSTLGIRRPGRATSRCCWCGRRSSASYAAYSPGRIKTALKHPMLVGTKLWALAHLISNGDLGSIILFGAILGWAVFDRITLKRRTDPGGPPIPVGGHAPGHHRDRRAATVDLPGCSVSCSTPTWSGSGVLELAR